MIQMIETLTIMKLHFQLNLRLVQIGKSTGSGMGTHMAITEQLGTMVI